MKINNRILCWLTLTFIFFPMNTFASSNTGGGFRMVDNTETQPSETDSTAGREPADQNPEGEPSQGGWLPQTGEKESSLLIICGSVVILTGLVVYTLNKKKNRRN